MPAVAAFHRRGAVRIKHDWAAPSDGQRYPDPFRRLAGDEQSLGLCSRGALPRGNALFERLGELLMDEFHGKTFLEITHHPRLHAAEQNQ
jgi:hypothetical protein